MAIHDHNNMPLSHRFLVYANKDLKTAGVTKAKEKGVASFNASWIIAERVPENVASTFLAYVKVFMILMSIGDPPS